MRLAGVSLNFALAIAMFSCSPIHSKGLEPVFATYGTGTLLHPIQEPTNLPPQDAACQAAKEHVYIYAANGLNPMCLGNFNGMCGYLKKQGYTNTYFGQMYTCINWANNIREVRKKDPQARVVLIGFSLGANSVRTIANDLNKDGTKVDLLVYLVGDTISNSPHSRPDNVRRVVNVRAKGLVLTGGDLFLNGADIEGARNETINVRHILIPSRKETLTLLNEELHTLVSTPIDATAAPEMPMLSPPAIIPPETPVRETKGMPASRRR